MPVRMDRLLRNRTYAVLVLSPVLLVTTVLVLPKQRPGQPSQNELVRQLASARWLMRAQAVGALQSLPVNAWKPPLRDAVIRAFGLEERRLRDKLEGKVPVSSYPEIGHEAFAEYYSALAGLVLQLHDPRVLPLIVDYTPSSDPRLTGYIARRGKSALPLVIARLDRLGGSSDFASQQAMLDTLTRLVLLNRAKKLRQPLSASDLASIRAAAQPLLRDPNPWVATRAARTLAISGAVRDQHVVRATFDRLLEDPDHNRREIALSAMSGLTDARFLPMSDLERIALSDDFRLRGPTATGRVGEYPLRRKAAQILKSAGKTR
ncbi:MAG: hypothetical protein ACRD18_14975 [Terriglobia bacterium]